MTTRALAHAYYDAHEKSGIQPVVKIMVPLVATVSEYLQQVHIIDREMHAAYLARLHTLRFAKQHFEKRLSKEREYELDYHPFKVGCMLETPRSCLIAKDLISIEDVGEENFALKASFFSLGTNDLTQMTFGYSRDDSSFFQAYEREKVALVDPFEILDWDGVGRLIVNCSRRDHRYKSLAHSSSRRSFRVRRTRRRTKIDRVLRPKRSRRRLVFRVSRPRREIGRRQSADSGGR